MPRREFVKRIRLNHHQKLLLCKTAREFPFYTCTDLEHWVQTAFDLPTPPNKGTISRILRSEATLLQQPRDSDTRRKKAAAVHVLVDQNVVEFIIQAECDGVCFNGAMIVFFASQVCEKLAIPHHLRPRILLSWLRCLQQRYGFRWRRSYGEASTVNLDTAKEELERVRAAVRMYPPRNVFNMDETAFFYNAAPQGSICKGSAPALKQSKSRVTMACCANADGTEKLPLLFLGTAAKPRWYSKKPRSLLYMGTSKGWMTTWMYQQWLVGLDEQMDAQDRKVLLLVDNASSHDETGLTLTHVRVEKLPPNTTAKIQPMDQGIIYCIKRKVLNQKMQHAFYCIGEVEPDSNPYHVELLTVMQWCESAWAQVAENTIRNCWLHSSLMSKGSVSFVLN